MRALASLALAAFLLVLGASRPAAVETARAARPLPPLAGLPVRPVGYKWFALKNGKPYTQTLIGKADGADVWRDSDGCTWTSPTGLFAPNTRWAGCGAASDGSQTVRREGEVWPLAPGRHWRYRQNGRNDWGTTWDAVRTCRVPGAARITTRAGAYDTYQVVCTDPWSTLTWYVSPALGTAVYYQRDHVERGVTTFEFVRMENPGRGALR